MSHSKTKRLLALLISEAVVCLALAFAGAIVIAALAANNPLLGP